MDVLMSARHLAADRSSGWADRRRAARRGTTPHSPSPLGTSATSIWRSPVTMRGHARAPLPRVLIGGEYLMIIFILGLPGHISSVVKSVPKGSVHQPVDG